MRTTPPYIPTLDGWRAIAILLVLLQHMTVSIGRAVPVLSKLGPHGVQIFFVLSGFLITRRLLEDDLSLRRFYIKRVFRILPLVCLFLGLLWLLRAKLPVSRDELLSSLFFIRNFTISSTLATDGQGWFTLHFWSLALEEQFYLLWPPLLAFAGSARARNIASAGVVAVFAWRVLCTSIGPSIYDHHFAWYLRPEFHFDSLLLGSFVALSWSRMSLQSKRLVGWAGAVSALIWCLLVVFTAGFPSTLEAVAAAAMMIATVLHDGSAVSRVLESAPMRFTGRISYGLYVWQQLFLAPKQLGQPLRWLQTIPISLLALFLVAVASYYGFERPAMRFGQHLTAGTASPQSSGRV